MLRVTRGIGLFLIIAFGSSPAVFATNCVNELSWKQRIIGTKDEALLRKAISELEARLPPGVYSSYDIWGNEWSVLAANIEDGYEIDLRFVTPAVVPSPITQRHVHFSLRAKDWRLSKFKTFERKDFEILQLSAHGHEGTKIFDTRFNLELASLKEIPASLSLVQGPWYNFRWSVVGPLLKDFHYKDYLIVAKRDRRDQIAANWKSRAIGIPQTMITRLHSEATTLFVSATEEGLRNLEKEFGEDFYVEEVLSFTPQSDEF